MGLLARAAGYHTLIPLVTKIWDKIYNDLLYGDPHYKQPEGMVESMARITVDSLY